METLALPLGAGGSVGSVGGFGADGGGFSFGAGALLLSATVPSAARPSGAGVDLGPGTLTVRPAPSALAPSAHLAPPPILLEGGGVVRGVRSALSSPATGASGPVGAFGSVGSFGSVGASAAASNSGVFVQPGSHATLAAPLASLAGLTAWPADRPHRPPPAEWPPLAHPKRPTAEKDGQGLKDAKGSKDSKDRAPAATPPALRPSGKPLAVKHVDDVSVDPRCSTPVYYINQSPYCDFMHRALSPSFCFIFLQPMRSYIGRPFCLLTV